MAKSALRLINSRIEFISPSRVSDLPAGLRGFYVLYRKRRKRRNNGKPCFDVVYVGMARKDVRGRLSEHLRKKKELWTHCSIFEVWDNIRDEEIEELEGILRHLYRRDAAANKLNAQGGFRKIGRLPPIPLNGNSAD